MSEQQTLPATTERPPCVVCGTSMDGEHHKRTSCSGCKPPQSKAGKRGKASAKVTPPATGPKVERTVSGGKLSAGAIKIKIEPLPVPDEEGEKHKYLLGTLPTCPIQNVHAGGMSFPLFTGHAMFDDRCNMLDGSGAIQRGMVYNLTEKQVDCICASVANKVLRFVGMPRKGYVPPFGSERKSKKVMRKRATIVQRDGVYKSQSGDEPLAAHLYMCRTDAMDFHGRDAEPQSMLQE